MTGKPALNKQALVVVPDGRTDLRTTLLDFGLYGRVCALIEAQYHVRLLWCQPDTNSIDPVTIAGQQLAVDTPGKANPPPSRGLMSPTMITCRQVYDYLRTRSDISILSGSNRGGLLYYVQSAKRQGIAFHSTTIEITLSAPLAFTHEAEGLFCTDYAETTVQWLEQQTAVLADRILSPGAFLTDWTYRNTLHTPTVDPSPAICYRSPITVIPSDQPRTELVFVGGLTRHNGLIHFIKALQQLESSGADFKVSFIDTSVTHPDLRCVVRDFIRHSSLHCTLVELPNNADALLDYLNAPEKLAITLPLQHTGDWTASVIHNSGLPCITSQQSAIAQTHSGTPTVLLTDSDPAEIASTLSGLSGARQFSSGTPSADAPPIHVHGLPEIGRHTIRPAELPIEQISVCLSHYCRPRMLESALESLCAQTVSGFEVLVVDDGSPSEHQPPLDDVCRRFSDRLTLRLIKTENQYLGACRNTGWRNAQGQYILFMDDDNIATPNELETFSRAIATSQVDILTCFSDTFEDQRDPGLTPTVKNRITPVGACLPIGALFNCFGDSNSFWRKSTLEAIDGFTELKGVGKDDNEIFARAILNGHSLSVVPERLFYYRLSANRMRHHHLNPEAGTYRVMDAYKQSNGSTTADLTNLVVGQHRTIRKLQQEIGAHRMLAARTAQRTSIVERLLKRIQKNHCSEQ